MKNFTSLVCTALFLGSTALTFAGNKAEVIIPGQDLSKVPFRMQAGLVEGVDYLPKTIIFKVKPQYRENCKVKSVDNIMAMQDFFEAVGSKNLGKIYPNHQSPAVERNALGHKTVDLSTIYSFQYANNLQLEKVINGLKSLGYVEYAEPWYIPTIQLVPNDANYGNSGQYFCKGNVAGSINTQQAWDIQTGSTSVVLGIVDTGTEPTHPDLSPNYLGGYDVAMNDNDPTWEGSNHGCAVSGDACAATNNSIGVASPGFNCKFKAAKIADASGALIASYAGIVWAADNGCKIINCSWGGSGGGSYGQGIIDYAVSKGSVVFASAGNGVSGTGQDRPLYPSSFINVYRVAATTNTDAKTGFSDYGDDIDFGSPGNGIYSTVNGSGYGSMSGTSMACPIAVGAAGLVQSQFNYSNAFQIAEKLKWTCDPYVGTTTLNLFNQGKLGRGRIDVYKALTQAAKSVVVNPITVTDGNDNAFQPNETLTISGLFTNLLDPTSSTASALLTVVSGPGTVATSSCTIGALATLGTFNNNATPFTLTINANAAINAVIKCRIRVTDGTFTGYTYFDITVNVDYINITINDVYTTITSKGRVGYNLDGQVQGLGFEYQLPSSNQTLYEMSLLIGTSSTQVSDMFRGATNGDADFGSVTRAQKTDPGVLSDFDVNGVFNDAPATVSAPLSVQARHSAYAWNTAPYRKFVIVKYVIKNTGGSTLNNLYAGLLADWDVPNANAAMNKAKWDATNKMGYIYDVATTGGTGIHVATKLLSTTGGVKHYAIDNANPPPNGGVNVADPAVGFTTAAKYTVLSTQLDNAGTAAAGGDVMNCVSSGPFTIAAGDSVEVAFALIAGDNLADIQASACASQDKYNNGCTGTGGIGDVENDNFWAYAFPIPAASSVSINYNLIGYENASLRIMNSLGEVVTVFDNLDQGRNTLTFDVSKLSTGNYFYQLRAGDAMMTKKFTIAR